MSKIVTPYREIKYFTWDEIYAPLKRQGITKDDIPVELRGNIIPTIIVLDELREQYGKPIVIDSTYRTAKYNKDVGGKDNSLHLSFNAIDWTVKNKEDLPKLYRLLAMWDGMPNKFSFLPKPTGNFGLGIYPTFIHLDTRSICGRKSPARWNG